MPEIQQSLLLDQPIHISEIFKPDLLFRFVLDAYLKISNWNI